MMNEDMKTSFVKLIATSRYFLSRPAHNPPTKPRQQSQATRYMRHGGTQTSGYSHRGRPTMTRLLARAMIFCTTGQTVTGIHSM